MSQQRTAIRKWGNSSACKQRRVSQMR
jgi:hypothetical protein